MVSWLPAVEDGVRCLFLHSQDHTIGLPQSSWWAQHKKIVNHDGYKNQCKVLFQLNFFEEGRKQFFWAHAVCVRFFLAHAVHARGSDGHQNVLWSISHSEQVKSKKPGVFQSRNKTNPKHKHNPNKHNKGRPRKKWNYACRKYNPHNAQYFFTMT